MTAGKEREPVSYTHLATEEYIDQLVKKAREAQAVYASFDQEGLNRTARAAARCVYDLSLIHI